MSYTHLAEYAAIASSETKYSDRHAHSHRGGDSDGEDNYEAAARSTRHHRRGALRSTLVDRDPEAWRQGFLLKQQQQRQRREEREREIRERFDLPATEVAPGLRSSHSDAERTAAAAAAAVSVSTAASGDPGAAEGGGGGGGNTEISFFFSCCSPPLWSNPQLMYPYWFRKA
mmetsp:Transcript_21610/g.42887  ORF Transcript_21610/g.42887 Transcript_21610/m.42887 type:complete len:172 (-) Transcript_21610:553-1068(-)